MSNHSHIHHRDPRKTLPVAVSGDGPYVIDSAGRRYFDASGGAAVSCLGHSEHRVTRAIKAQLDALPYAHSSFFTTQPAEELADFLVKAAPSDGQRVLDHVYFVSGGSEANETAMKLARQYFWERGEIQRVNFIARKQSYHGNTLGALSAGYSVGRRAIHEPILLNVHHIAPCFEYHYGEPGESSEAYALRAANELEAEILRLGPDTVIAFIAETVVGATSGAVPPAPGYFQRIREICDRYGVLLIMDEVMSGMGRIGTRFGYEQYDCVPDILTCAKGLGAGYQPIGATMMSRDIHETLVAGSGAFSHGFTYIGHATACAGALAVQKVIDEDGLLENVRQKGAALMTSLRNAFGAADWCGDIRGNGLFIGIELVADRAAKTSFDPALRLHARIKAAAMDEELMCYPSGGTVDGRRGDHVLLAPPFILTDDHVALITERLERAITRVLREERLA